MMQDPNQSPFSSRPPLPTPDGNVFPPEPTPLLQRGDWKSAPVVVKGWAYPLTWLVMVITCVGILAGFTLFGRAPETAILVLAISVFFLGVFIWLNRAFKKGTYAAWIVQIVYSGFVVLSFPVSLLTRGGNPLTGLIGLAIHGYILSQWFKPETKAWFGKS